MQNGSLTPEKKNRSRPPSYSGADFPITLRTRSSTCSSLQLGISTTSINRQMPPPLSNQSKKTGKIGGMSSLPVAYYTEPFPSELQEAYCNHNGMGRWHFYETDNASCGGWFY